jgi:hypothetical protein
MKIINAENAGQDMKCDDCGSHQKAHEMEECFVGGNTHHPGAGHGAGVLCRECYHKRYRTNVYGYPERV